jgi:predicted N-acetyltransferase YhbS
MSSILESLVRGALLPDKGGRLILYRFLSPTDDMDELTAMLHEAYAPLAAAGMRFVASYQDSSVTRERTERGETLVATDEGSIVGVITLADAEKTSGSPWYDRPDVASLGQFAVRPAYQHAGIGGTLMRLAEDRAREKGVERLGLDTSEHATQLLALYLGKGYQVIEYSQWQVTNYRSIILGKTLS